MLFKERLYLSNCDSVKKLGNEEIRKRVLIGLTFGNGIILSPNILLENESIINIFKQNNVIKYLNEDGEKDFVIRGFNLENNVTMADYFDRLPDTYRLSSFDGVQKKDLSSSDLQKVKDRISQLDKVLNDVEYQYENISISPRSLSNEIITRLHDDQFENFYQYEQFTQAAENLHSRSEWYKFLHEYPLAYEKKTALFYEIIDPAYNSLFLNKNEGFFQDNIKILENVPGQILDVAMSIKALRKELELISYALKAFKLVYDIQTGGLHSLLNIIKDEAKGYIKDKIVDNKLQDFSRKNWYGLYPELTKKMGLEIK